MADEGTPAPAGPEELESGTSPERLLTIGQVVRELKAEFPELSISKLRYLEDRGLVTPRRTKTRYRKYSPEDVRALRGVLAMQRDDYLPLEVIRQRVERAGAGGGRSGGAAGGQTIRLIREEPVYTLEGLCGAGAVDEEFVLGLTEFRLIERQRESGAMFGESDLEVVRICQRLARYDVEPRHLRILSSAAEREAAFIEQLATPSLRSAHADRKEYGLETVEELGSLLSQLMHLLLRKELQRII